MSVYKEFKKNKRSAIFDKINFVKKIKYNLDLLRKAKLAPDPIKNSITENIAFVLDDAVVDIIHCQPKMAAILLSEPKIVKIPSGSDVKIGWVYLNNKFVDPKDTSIFKTFPHERK